MVAAFIVVLALLFSAPQQVPDIQQWSRDQADYYLQQNASRNHPDANYWALLQLSRANATIEQYIWQQINSKKSINGYQQAFLSISPDTSLSTEAKYNERLASAIRKTGSPGLYIAFMLSGENEEAQQFNTYLKFSSDRVAGLVKALERKQDIQPYLTTGAFSFADFLLFFNYTLPDDFIQSATSRWFSDVLDKKNYSLIHSLKLAAVFKGLYTLDRFNDIQDLYSQLSEDRFFPNSSLKIRIMRALDYSVYRLGNYDLSIKLQRNTTIPLAKFLDNKKLINNTSIAFASNLYMIGKIQEAQKEFENIYTSLNKNETGINKSVLFNNLGVTYLKTGDFNKYLQLQFKALESAKENDDYDNQLNIYRNLHVYHRKKGDISTALSYLLKAQDLAKKHGDSRDLSSIYLSLGSYYRDYKNNYIKSEKYFDKSESLINKLSNYSLYNRLLFERAKLNQVENNLKIAYKLHKQILNYASQKSDVPTYLENIIDLADLNIQMEQYAKAQQQLKELHQYDISQLDFKTIVKAKTLEARLLTHNQQYTEAYDLLKPTLNQVIERARNSADFESGYWRVENEYVDLFQLAAELLIQDGQPGQAVAILDQLKTINDAALYDNPLVKSSLLSEAELTKDKRLSDRLDQLRKKLLSATGDEQIEIQSKIDQLSAEKRSLYRQMSEYADEKDISIRKIQKRLSYNQLVLHITALNNTFYVASITKSNVHFRRIPLTDSLQNALTSAVHDVSTGHTNLDELYRVYQGLKLSKLPKGIKQLTVIPDSYLFQLPLEILPTQKPDNSYSFGSSHYMIEKYQINYLTSLEELERDRPNTKHHYKESFTAYGVSRFGGYQTKHLVSLPYATTEVNEIRQELTNLKPRQVFTQQEATENTFRHTAPQSRIIHLATHSEVSDRDPLFSTIYLAPDTTLSRKQKKYNGRVFAYELFELNLSNDLIMLNSCESGSGPYLQGAGVMGLSRALRYAGAKSLVLNLWSVNDKLASDFAVQFYKALNEGDTKPEALRKAKLYFLKKGNANPQYWGPYMLLGNTEPVVDTGWSWNQWVIAIVILFSLSLLGGVYISRRRNRLV